MLFTLLGSGGLRFFFRWRPTKFNFTNLVYHNLFFIQIPTEHETGKTG